MRNATRHSRLLKDALTSVSIIISSDWSQPFELMCKVQRTRWRITYRVSVMNLSNASRKRLKTVFLMSNSFALKKKNPAIFSLKNDAMVVNKFLKKNIFSQFETPRAIISDEAEVSNKEIKKILEKVVDSSCKDWVDHLDSMLRAYRTAKTSSRWSRPFVVNKIFPHGAMEIASLDEKNEFKVNRQRLKAYYEDKDRIKVSMDLM
ncbi:Retrovirus-related Pol polyprotein from transposon 17.6 [Cucumis melo var. makuwa]|uniref:Retrovirus-related Pol polyprotein from transposon 17.6 n=1 Tax=Cucumis melo var. makuwa TaxID=1194695 RepID=A0A5D3DQC6_CUCMM|nr:Retrovirus-related Pol polyprotein from transposon 17.6 [Cucumis melo var. makuwa]